MTMNLRFVKEHLSIKQLPAETIPDFTVLTGINGAGKSHFLQALKAGAIVAEGMGQIEYHNWMSLRPKQQVVRPEELEKELITFWRVLNAQRGIRVGHQPTSPMEERAYRERLAALLAGTGKSLDDTTLQRRTECVSGPRVCNKDYALRVGCQSAVSGLPACTRCLALSRISRR